MLKLHILLLIIISISVLFVVCESKNKKIQKGENKETHHKFSGPIGNYKKGGNQKNKKNKKSASYAYRKPSSQFNNPSRRETCSLAGQWFDEWGNEMVIGEGMPRGNTILVEGKFISKTQLQQEALLHGTKSYDNKGVTFGVVVIMEEGSVYGFNGECYIKGTQEILLTSWLLRLPVARNESSMATKTGTSKFRRYKLSE